MSILDSGIYSILNKLNGKIYVGLTEHLSSRKSTHFSLLRNNKHFNPHLQSSFNKYGESAFEFNVIEYCDVDKLDECEDWWINYFDTTNPEKGYNLKTGGFSDHKRNKSTCMKISNSLTGRTFSEEHKKNLSNSKKGIISNRFGTSPLEDWGGFWFLKTMATSNISLIQLSKCIGINKESIRTYLRSRGCTWTSLKMGSKG